MPPIVLFGIQFTFSLVAYALIAWWYVAPRLSRLPRELALVPLVWIHAFRIVGGTILAPGAVDAAVPGDFRTMIGYGDMATAVLALYLNFFVLIAQAFQKVPSLKALAPTQTEQPFKLTQLVFLILFVTLTAVAAKRFRSEQLSAA